MKKAKMKKIGNIVLNVLTYAFLAICIFSVFLTVLSKKDTDGAAEIFGYQMRVVTSESMAKSEYTDTSSYDIKDIPLRSMVFIKLMPDDPAKADEWYRSLREGDVLTFRYVYTTQITITHRISKIYEKDTGGFIIELTGDNKNSEEGQLTQIIDTSIPNNTNYVLGKVTGQAKFFGVIMTFLMQPIGLILVIILPCFIIILLEIVKISRALLTEKKKKQEEEIAKRDHELEKLRHKLEELEKENRELAVAAQTEDLDHEAMKEDQTE
ncbi:MAG: hypothetical protein IKD07_05715 [Clostridia bacterium]|nr:hypothetical protein [Clostridia bacterium]